MSPRRQCTRRLPAGAYSPQAHRSCLGLVEDDLAVAHEPTIHVVNSHGAVVWTTHASEPRTIPRRTRGIVNVQELTRGVPNILNEFGGNRVVLVLRFLSEKGRARDHHR